jgi:ubiquinone/menaquinone biosynthesis C-methylase UbiE
MMAWQNRALNRFAVRCLNVGRSDVVLEIGFGPGEAIHRLATRTSAKWIAGVDPSEIMLNRACQRNESFIHNGRVRLSQGSVEALPFGSGYFTHVFSVSTFQDWDNQSAALAEVRRVLAEHGVFAVCLRRMPRLRFPWSAPGSSEIELFQDQQLIAKHGFRDVRQIRNRFRRFVCLIARR